MDKLVEILIILVVLILLAYFYNMKYDNKIRKESFKNYQNEIYNNYKDDANMLQYGKDDNMKGMYQNPPPQIFGPSDQIGVNQNSPQDVYDNRGYKWSSNASDPAVDTFTQAVDNSQLRNAFERTYMLDPDGSVAQFDITYNKISPNCCPAQYSPPFKLTDKDETNCDYAQKYVANNYSGMNYQDGYGCPCITPKQADFYGTRGGNTF